MKKNKRRLQKKKQQRALKNKKRRNEYLKEKRKVEEVTIRWDDLNFLDTWKSLEPADLMDKCFKFDVVGWIEQWVRPKRLRDYNALHYPDTLSELLHQTFDNTIDAWASDTNGFSENLPERWRFNEKNQNKFISMMKSSVEDTDEITDEDIQDLMKTDRSEWFSVVFSDMIDNMVEVLVPYILVEVHSMSFMD